MRRNFTALATAVLVILSAGFALPAAAASEDPGQARRDAAHQGHEKGQGEKGQGHKAKGPQADKSDPPGNNGTVKIAPAGEEDGTPDNNPHPGCTFQIEWYGFDEGSDVWSTVEFQMQAPTSDVGLSGTSPERVFVGEDPATGAGTETGQDATQAYTLAFAGEPHPQQGYHVKLTVHTPYSKGADTKHKVYWVEPCEEESETPETAPEAAEGEQAPVEESDTGAEQSEGTNTETEVGGEQAQDEVVVLGAQASQGSPGTQAAEAPAEASATVPTSVDAGMSGAEKVKAALPLLAVLFGLAMTGAALLRRRRARV